MKLVLNKDNESKWWKKGFVIRIVHSQRGRYNASAYMHDLK